MVDSLFGSRSARMWTVLGGMAGVASLVWAVLIVGTDKSSDSGGNASSSVQVQLPGTGAAATPTEDPTSPVETSAASAPTTTAAPTPASVADDPVAAPTPASVADDPAAPGPVWMAQLASVAVGDKARLNTVVLQIRRDVPDAQVLASSEFASLRPGYWVVYATGGFASGWDALAFCTAHGRPDGRTCFGRLLSHDASDLTYQCYPGAAASAARCERD
jgi:eukaryotic-like serine/threonine-protein kinase